MRIDESREHRAVAQADHLIGLEAIAHFSDGADINDAPSFDGNGAVPDNRLRVGFGNDPTGLDKKFLHRFPPFTFDFYFGRLPTTLQAVISLISSNSKRESHCKSCN
jgi:hypothetical protein